MPTALGCFHVTKFPNLYYYYYLTLLSKYPYMIYLLNVCMSAKFQNLYYYYYLTLLSKNPYMIYLLNAYMNAIKIII